ncbi:MAG: hypothetical protein HOE43_08400 [Chloroflexi bacterium]|jgi:hypothetical protein|nr:hypothetical protein [Chloroflexota bacterium]
MSSSVRDLIITGWAIIFAVTIGVVVFHPSFKEESAIYAIRIAGLAFISMMAGILLLRFTEITGRSSARTKKTILGIFIVCMLPLIPVGLATFGMPWAGLIIATLVYVRWKWALAASSSSE